MNAKYLLDAKQDIKNSLKADQLIIFFTRIIEDLQNNKQDFYGRIKELFLVLHPYEELTRSSVYEFVKTFNFNSEFGLEINKQEKEMLLRLCLGLQRDFTFRDSNTSKGIALNSLRILNQKYLPNSSEIIEPFILGKMISFFAGIENLYKKPASTIQLLGAEKALFQHKAMNKQPPKYGILYKSKIVQLEKNKGKAARQIANKLSIKLKMDYFQNFAR